MRLLEAEKEETKLPAILRAAVRLFVEKGVAGTTIRDIAGAAGVAEGTLYRHFESKDALARWVLISELEDFTALLDRMIAQRTGLAERVSGIVVAFAAAYEEDPEIARFILFCHASELSGLSKRMRQPRQVVLDVLREAVAAGELPRASDIELLQSLFLGALLRFLLSRVYGEIRGDLRRRVPEVTRACLGLLRGA